MTGIDHVAFEVSNMDLSLRFYTHTLGLKLLFRHVNEAEQEDYAFLELDGGNLELIQRLGGVLFEKQEPRPPYCPHLALTSDDMDRTLQMIADKHISLLNGPLEIAGAERWVYITDPDNNVIEFIQWLSK